MLKSTAMINSIELPAIGIYDLLLSACSNSADNVKNYYLALISGLCANQRLDNEEKIGQLAFLIKEWQAELALDRSKY